MWQCSKCGQKSEKKLSSSSSCVHQWFDEHDIVKIKERQAKEQMINRAVLAFNDELLNTEDGQKKMKGENGWSWLGGNKGKEKINVENIDIDRDIAICWLNSFFGEKWLAGEYGRQYLIYLNEMEKWQAGKSFNEKKTNSTEAIEVKTIEVKNNLTETIEKISEKIPQKIPPKITSNTTTQNVVKTYNNPYRNRELAEKEYEKSENIGCLCVIGIFIILIGIFCYMWFKGDKSNNNIEVNDAVTYNDQGTANYGKGDYTKAITDFSQAIKLKPDYAVAYNNRGLVYYKKGEYKKAIADFSQAIKLNPNYENAKQNLEIAKKKR